MLSGKDVNVGDIVKMKKAHPCGSDEWEITRTGMDFGMKCCGCGHFVMLARTKFEKAAKAVVKSAAADKGNALLLSVGSRGAFFYNLT